MASMLSQTFKNLPANSTEMSALKELLDSDLEHRSFILRRQEKVQARYTYAKNAAEVFADCLAMTNAVKDAFAASILSTKTLEKALKNTLNLYDNHHDILAPTSSTNRHPPANLHRGGRGETTRDHHFSIFVLWRRSFNSGSQCTFDNSQPRSIHTLCDLQALAGYLPIHTSAMEVCTGAYDIFFWWRSEKDHRTGTV